MSSAGSSESGCPFCGCEVLKKLCDLEDQEKTQERSRGSRDIPLLAKLKPPLQPPKEPLTLGIGCLAFFVILFLMSFVGYNVNWFLDYVLAFLAAAGVFFLFRRVYERRLADWREEVEGAYVCLRCWATFK